MTLLKSLQDRVTLYNQELYQIRDNEGTVKKGPCERLCE
jgi:hypothetical protein